MYSVAELVCCGTHHWATGLLIPSTRVWMCRVRERNEEGGLPVTEREAKVVCRASQAEPIDECKKEQRQYTGDQVCARQGGRCHQLVMHVVHRDLPHSGLSTSRGIKNIVCRYHRVAAPARRVLCWGAVTRGSKGKARLTDWVGGRRP